MPKTQPTAWGPDRGIPNKSKLGIGNYYWVNRLQQQQFPIPNYNRLLLNKLDYWVYLIRLAINLLQLWLDGSNKLHIKTYNLCLGYSHSGFMIPTIGQHLDIHRPRLQEICQLRGHDLQRDFFPLTATWVSQRQSDGSSQRKNSPYSKTMF